MRVEDVKLLGDELRQQAGLKKVLPHLAFATGKPIGRCRSAAIDSRYRSNV